MTYISPTGWNLWSSYSHTASTASSSTSTRSWRASPTACRCPSGTRPPPNSPAWSATRPSTTTARSPITEWTGPPRSSRRAPIQVGAARAFFFQSFIRKRERLFLDKEREIKLCWLRGGNQFNETAKSAQLVDVFVQSNRELEGGEMVWNGIRSARFST